MKDSVLRGVISLKGKLSTASDKPGPCSHHVTSSLNSYLYIFTSGTTGMIHFFFKFKKKAIVVGNILPWVMTWTLTWFNFNLVSHHVHLPVDSRLVVLRTLEYLKTLTWPSGSEYEIWPVFLARSLLASLFLRLLIYKIKRFV